MSDRLKGKHAFVTAAGAGIGRATAIAFAREGATVFATDIDEKGLASLASEGVSEVARLDVRDTAAVTAMAKRVGPVDILFNAAGFVHHGTVLDCSDEECLYEFTILVRNEAITAANSTIRPGRARVPVSSQAKPRPSIRR